MIGGPFGVAETSGKTFVPNYRIVCKITPLPTK